MSKRLNILSVVFILGVLLSYSYDLTCVLESGELTGKICLCQESMGDDCSHPLVGSAGGVALPIHAFHFKAVRAARPIFCWVLPTSDLPSNEQHLLSVGLRAPPTRLV